LLSRYALFLSQLSERRLIVSLARVPIRAAALVHRQGRLGAPHPVRLPTPAR
jgi:hypothetical protein